jgi:hypothetical protein
MDEVALADAHRAGKVEGFHISHFPKGHRATDFERWFAGSAGPDAVSDGSFTREKHGLDTYPVKYEESFEPYVIVARDITPAYDERFRGYGMNKISHLYTLAEQGFAFHVLDHRDTFVIAQKHPNSSSWQVMYGPDADLEHRCRLSVHWAEFKKELRTKQLDRAPHAFAANKSSCKSQPWVAGPSAGQALQDEYEPARLLVAATAALLATHLGARVAELACALEAIATSTAPAAAA